MSTCESGPFMPDVDLVLSLAAYLRDAPTSTHELLAFGVLRHLYDLGIELPVATQFDGSGDGKTCGPTFGFTLGPLDGPADG